VSKPIDHGPFEEPDQQRASGLEYAAELPERNSDRVWLVVDQGIPGENSADRTVCEIEGVEAAGRERHIGKVLRARSMKSGTKSIPWAERPCSVRKFVH
jgi:hypothetical protein